MELLLIWLAVATVTAIAANGRGRSAFGWFALGVLFSVFALIAVLVMPRADGQGAARADSRDDAHNDPYPPPNIRAMRGGNPTRQNASPPRLLGDSTFDQFVVGTSNYQHALEHLSRRAGTRKALVTLTAQPDNPHDREAVVVTDQSAILGYLPREDARAFHEDLAALNLRGAIVQAWAKPVGGTADKPTRGLRLDIVWPLDVIRTD